MIYPPVPRDATAGDLAGRSLAVVGTGPDHRETLVIVEFGAVGDGVVNLQIADTALRNPVPMVRQVRAPVTAALRELVLAHAGVTAQRAGRDVDVQWPDAGPHPTTVRMALKVLPHAETVGLAHLPLAERDQGRRAASAARLARAATTDTERQAAEAQVIRILGSLALYYLPGPDDYRRAITPR